MTSQLIFMFCQQKCVGASDGIHISAHASGYKSTAYRDRCCDISQNVICACNFDMSFTYVHAGWEGSAHDSRVMQVAIVDSGFNSLGHPEVNTISTLFNAIIHVVIVSVALFVLSLFFALLQAHTILSIRGMPLVLHSSHCISRLDIVHKSSKVLPDNLQLPRSSLTIGIPHSAWSLSNVLEC